MKQLSLTWTHQWKILLDNHTYRAAEVQYFTQLAIRVNSEDASSQLPNAEEKWEFINAACVFLFTHFDADLNRLSYETVKACQFLGEPSIAFVHVKNIISIVGMIPHPFNRQASIGEHGQYYFVVDMSRLDGAYNRPEVDNLDNDEDNDNT